MSLYELNLYENVGNQTVDSSHFVVFFFHTMEVNGYCQHIQVWNTFRVNKLEIFYYFYVNYPYKIKWSFIANDNNAYMAYQCRKHIV